MICLTVAWLVLAAPEDAAPLDTGPEGMFVGEDWRFQNMSLVGGLLKRTLADFISIPTGLSGWGWADWTVFSLVTAQAVILSVPLNPSIDARLQLEIRNRLGPTHPRLWQPGSDVWVWVGLFSGVGSMLAYGLALGDNHNPYVENALLAVEAFVVMQVYVNILKLVTGREGTRDNQGLGEYHGPQGFLKYAPGGTPSGHIASIWTVFTVVMDYWKNPVVDILLGAVACVLTATIVTDDYHFVSEAILGAGIGIAVGRWVVRHRSSRYRYGEGGVLDRVVVAPMALPGSGYGLAASLSF